MIAKKQLHTYKIDQTNIFRYCKEAFHLAKARPLLIQSVQSQSRLPLAISKDIGRLNTPYKSTALKEMGRSLDYPCIHRSFFDGFVSRQLFTNTHWKLNAIDGSYDDPLPLMIYRRAIDLGCLSATVEKLLALLCRYAGGEEPPDHATNNR